MIRVNESRLFSTFQLTIFISIRVVEKKEVCYTKDNIKVLAKQHNIMNKGINHNHVKST